MQLGAFEASDKVKAAINDGADIIIQGASSAIGGQITGDVLKHKILIRQGGDLPQRRRRGDGVYRAEMSLLSFPVERQRRDPAARRRWP